MEVKGIDVSTWQGDIDWKQVAAGTTRFAMLRASFGSNGIDRKFLRNITNAPKEGIHCGAYHYCYANTVQGALREADHFLEVISPYQFPYPVSLDLEDSALTSLGKKTLTDIAQAFMERVRDAGYYVCLYSNLNWMVNLLDMDRLSSFDVWLAQWSSKPTYQGDFGMWQHSSEGELPGIPALVDLNISYRDYPSIIKGAGQNGFGNQGGQPAPDPDPGPNSGTYTVKAGDTLSGIAQKFGVSLDALIRANPQISNPSVIYTGQVITIPAEGGSQPSPEPDPSPEPESTTYTVKAGDSMSSIAKKYGVNLDALIRANPQISNPNVIYAGQVLTIPKTGSGGSAPSPAPEPEAQTYTVKEDDTLSGIAKKYGVTLSDLLAANPQIKNPNVIRPGQTLTIPGKGTVPAPAPQPKKYVVKSGDTLSGIAKKLDVTLSALIQANAQIKNPDVIYPGQILTVPIS